MFLVCVCVCVHANFMKIPSTPVANRCMIDHLDGYIYIYIYILLS
jgi:hypothetical protein